MKRNPGGSIDLIGSAFAIGSGIVSLIQDAIPDKHTRRVNKAIRQLNGRYKKMDVNVYVANYFQDYSSEKQQDVINFLNQTINR